MMNVSEREFDLAIERIEKAIENGAERLETVMLGFDARLRATEKQVGIQMWFWRLTGAFGLAVLGAYLRFRLQ